MKKLSELRPCDACGGPVRTVFYVVRVSLAHVNVNTVNQFLGMRQFFGGRAGDALVENFVPGVNEAVTVAGDKEPDLMTELAICQDCYIGGRLNLPMLVERVSERAKSVADAEASR